MECVCGCGRKVPRKLTDLDLRASDVALELLAWSKMLAGADANSPDNLEIERLAARGASCYQSLISTLHGDQDDASLGEADRWLVESRSIWHDLPEMMEKGSFLGGPKLHLTDHDFRQLDRERPERSFLATDAPLDEPVPAADVAGQLERLGALRVEGVLTEEEFRAAKSRVLGLGTR